MCVFNDTHNTLKTITFPSEGNIYVRHLLFYLLLVMTTPPEETYTKISVVCVTAAMNACVPSEPRCLSNEKHHERQHERDLMLRWLTRSRIVINMIPVVVPQRQWAWHPHGAESLSEIVIAVCCVMTAHTAVRFSLNVFSLCTKHINQRAFLRNTGLIFQGKRRVFPTVRSKAISDKTISDW